MDHRVTIGADGTEVSLRIDRACTLARCERPDVVDMDKPLSDRAELPYEREATDLARRAVNGNAALAQLDASTVSRRSHLLERSLHERETILHGGLRRLV